MIIMAATTTRKIDLPGCSSDKYCFAFDKHDKVGRREDPRRYAPHDPLVVHTDVLKIYVYNRILFACKHPDPTEYYNV